MQLNRNMSISAGSKTTCAKSFRGRVPAPIYCIWHVPVQKVRGPVYRYYAQQRAIDTASAAAAKIENRSRQREAQERQAEYDLLESRRQVCCLCCHPQLCKLSKHTPSLHRNVCIGRLCICTSWLGQKQKKRSVLQQSCSSVCSALRGVPRNFNSCAMRVPSSGICRLAPSAYNHSGIQLVGHTAAVIQGAQFASFTLIASLHFFAMMPSIHICTMSHQAWLSA